LGRNTAGAFPDILSRQLPNGWVFVLKEEYTYPDGTFYEKMESHPMGVYQNQNQTPFGFGFGSFHCTVLA
jgi:hypothetical protein